MCEGAGMVLDVDACGITLSANVIARHLAGGIFFLRAWNCTVTGDNFLQVRADALLVSARSGRLNMTGNSFSND